MSKISIVLTTFNGEKYISHCLNSIFDQTFQDFKVLIIENASADNTAKIIKTNYPATRDSDDHRNKLQTTNYPDGHRDSDNHRSKLELIENKKNSGFCGGYNQGIREVIENSEYVFILNQDIILEKNFLEEVVKFLETNPKIGALMPKIYRWDFDKNEKTNIIDSNGIKMFKNRRAIEIGQGEKDEGQYNEIKEILGVTGACAIFNSQALKDIEIKLNNKTEYLDENFFAYKEDVDLSLRLRIYGWNIFFLPSAKAYHDRTAKREKSLSDISAALNRKNKSKLINYLSYKNHLSMLVKNEFLSNFIFHFLWIFFYEFKKFIFFLIFEFSTFKSLFEFFKQLPQILEKRKIIMSHRKINAKEMRKWME
ncbi:MAG: glycosyltransferase family 2 protein [Candidatus Kuenenbacteria bacterium]